MMLNLNSFKNLVQKVVVAIQAVLVTIALFLVYFAGIGLTRMVTFIPALIASRTRTRDSYWTDVEDYDSSEKTNLRQS